MSWRRLLTLIAAFAAMVVGIESLRVLAAWWAAGGTEPGWEVVTALIALVVVLVAWWRHSVFACGRGQCLMPETPRSGADGQE